MQSIYHLTPVTTASRSEIGSKAHSLIELMKAGFCVPGGFVLSTVFFTPWVNWLKTLPLWADFISAGGADLTTAAAQLKNASCALRFNDNQKSALAPALSGFAPQTLFAVRSSSPDEDLASASFAGVYETELGVPIAALEKAVRSCFLSFLDARIVIYKRQMGLSVDEPRIAIIVQKQLDSEVAGVAFSINPLNNDHDEVLLNANWGQGETVVAGLSSPDCFIVNKHDLLITNRNIGMKETSLWLAPSGGTVEYPHDRHADACLGDDKVLEITSLLKQVEALYQCPIDVEWAIECGKVYLLQARPITTHLPVPTAMATPSGKAKRLYWDLTISIHGSYEPMSPLGCSIINALVEELRREAYGGGRRLDIDHTLPVIAGGRLYINLNNFARLVGKAKVVSHVKKLDTLAAQAIQDLDFQQLARGHAARFLPLLQLLWRMPVRIANGIRAFRSPQETKARWENRWRYFRNQLDEIGRQERSPEAYVSAIMQEMLRFVLREELVLFVASRVALKRISNLFPQASTETLSRLDALDQSLPGNVTVEMGIALHQISSLLTREETRNPTALRCQLEEGSARPDVLHAWRSFLTTYGHRGPKEIDVFSPRFREEPDYLIRELASYLESDSPIAAPFALMEEGQRRRREAYAFLADQLARLAPNKLKKLANWYDVVQTFGGFRETHKFVGVYAIDRVRSYMLELGRKWVEGGRLRDVGDIFMLDLAEVERAAKESELDLGPLVRAGRQNLSQSAMRKNVFPVMDSRGRFYVPQTQESLEGHVTGYAVSPGLARGRIKVLACPSEKELLLGEILVARATDPSWTPLFVNAAAIILEVGGVLQHGALVAREYGKPCVSGIQNATGLFHDGEEVEVDGNLGLVRQLVHKE